MRTYDLYLAVPVDGKDLYTITTSEKLVDLNKWLIKLVNNKEITKDIARSVLYVA